MIRYIKNIQKKIAIAKYKTNSTLTLLVKDGIFQNAGNDLPMGRH